MRKLVVKIGSSTLTDADGRADYAYLARFAEQVSQVKEAGWQPIIVTSGAIACGLEALHIATRPSDMPSLQAAASVGQSVLSGEYAAALAPYGILTGSVLLTRRDTAAIHSVRASGGNKGLSAVLADLISASLHQ